MFYKFTHITPTFNYVKWLQNFKLKTQSTVGAAHIRLDSNV